ncbi:uncharacterized protein LOC108215211 isoform X2 [Daucus carota subsp. sativus]|uniref:uncharacterized protein LOC108215211 isoform X2 n=1 Tax=Daucus carota subsp. sativus TaxID=79200 RepID=UPI0007EF785B|nr:PREDICTED: uncharacterized protein LOC108215211 isoform X2 [Daucus carota subsp. sativus]
MWGFGGKHYWGRRDRGEQVEGVIVIFAWMSSERKHVQRFVQLFASLGWNSLVCHSQFLNMFFPEKGASLASEILYELSEELKVRPCPVVFASFSGGPKACMCKVLQIIEENYAEQSDQLKITLVQQMGAPYLILCSEDDDLAPFHTICNFAQRLKDLGGDVKLVKWSNSSHVGHYKHYPVDYKAAVTELLGKAAVLYSKRIRRIDKEKIVLDGKEDDVAPSPGHLENAAMSSSQTIHRRVALELNDHLFVPISSQCHGDEAIDSVHDEYKESYVPITKPPVIKAHGILGQALFGLCVPEDVDDWHIKPSLFLEKKGIRRSKL